MLWATTKTRRDGRNKKGKAIDHFFINKAMHDIFQC